MEEARACSSAAAPAARRRAEEMVVTRIVEAVEGEAREWA